jgi:hypothetical protein
VNSPLHVFAVTCRVPRGSGKHLRVTAAGRTVTAESPDGFFHEFELPPEAATDAIQWQVHQDVLELRTAYRPRAHTAPGRGMRHDPHEVAQGTGGS